MPEYNVVSLVMRPALCERVQVPAAQIGPQMGESLGKVFQYVMSHGGQPAGPPYSRYYNFGEPTVDFESGMPLVAPIAPGDGLQATEIPGLSATEVPGLRGVTTVYTGPYDGLGQAWQELYAWLGANGFTSTAALEEYLTDPGAEPDPSKWQTRLIAVVAS